MTRPGTPRYANYWVAPEAKGFQYWTDAKTGEDVQFLDGGSIMWSFGPLQVRAQDKGLFTVPSKPVPCSRELFSQISIDMIPYAKLSKLVNK
jgi:hypothetical protein